MDLQLFIVVVVVVSLFQFFHNIYLYSHKKYAKNAHICEFFFYDPWDPFTENKNLYPKNWNPFAINQLIFDSHIIIIILSMMMKQFFILRWQKFVPFICCCYNHAPLVIVVFIGYLLILISMRKHTFDECKRETVPKRPWMSYILLPTFMLFVHFWNIIDE